MKKSVVKVQTKHREQSLLLVCHSVGLLGRNCNCVLVGSGNTCSSTGNTSASTEMLISDSKEVVSSVGKEVGVCEMSATPVLDINRA